MRGWVFPDCAPPAVALDLVRMVSRVATLVLPYIGSHSHSDPNAGQEHIGAGLLGFVGRDGAGWGCPKLFAPVWVAV